MKIAIPIVDGRLSPHFGHCESFAFLEVNRAERKILQRTNEASPPHQPGMLPEWLEQKGVQVIMAGGMGVRAQQLFSQKGIQVLIGAPSVAPEELVTAWMNESLVLGENICDH
jgi:predicted Fe-Mo cluster-binding NifX family protein